MQRRLGKSRSGFGQQRAEKIAQLYAGIEKAQDHVQSSRWIVQQANLHHHIDEGERDADEQHTQQSQTEIKQTRQGKHHGKQGVEGIEADVAVDVVVGCPTSRDLADDETQTQNNQHDDAQIEGRVRMLVKPSNAVSPSGGGADEDAQGHHKQQLQTRAFQGLQLL